MAVWLALKADPFKALQALIARLRGQQVRARRLLGEAASRHPSYYRWWAARHGPAAISRWCAANPSAGSNSHVAVLILPGESDAAEATRANLAAVLPAAELIAPAATLGDTLISLAADWLIILAPGDRLIQGLAPVIASLQHDRTSDVVFWDHAIEAPGCAPDPVVKPNWDPVLAATQPLLGSAAALRAEAVDALLKQQPDLATEPLSTTACGRLQNELAAAAPPRHVPLILTRVPSAASWNMGGPRVDPEEPEWDIWPGVSIVVPTRDEAALLAQCIAGLDQLDYPGPVELLVLDNDSFKPQTRALFAQLAERARTRVLPAPGEFNFAAMMNRAAQEAGEPFLCLLNNDVLPRDGAWLAAMIRHARLPQVGAVGARLLYPNGTIQHAGVAIGIGGAAGHVARGTPDGAEPFALWHRTTRRVSAVTAACLVLDRSKYLAVGGMDAEAFAVDFNDVDLCLRLDQAGWENRIVAEASLIHHESYSRGRKRGRAGLVRFEAELSELQRRWRTDVVLDPWHSPLFSSESERCLLRY